jgi:glucosamine 6-phosphate synthetase-like amidotransferase/phosphosugar isomerase protein
MCGIGAIAIKNGNACEYIKKILIGQENRGRSSTGIAYLNNNEIKIIKDIVAPSEFVKRNLPEFKVGICHNRMPSVGSIKIENAHPFISCDNEFAFVYNGTFSSYELLKSLLNEKHNIKGDTDAEIICHFIEEYGKIKSYKQIIKGLNHGNFLLLFKNKIIGFGYDLILISDSNGVYIAQEENAFSFFKGQRKYVYKISGYFEIDLNTFKISIDGNVHKERKVILAKKKEKSYNKWSKWVSYEYWFPTQSELTDFELDEIEKSSQNQRQTPVEGIFRVNELNEKQIKELEKLSNESYKDIKNSKNYYYVKIENEKVVGFFVKSFGENKIIQKVGKINEDDLRGVLK